MNKDLTEIVCILDQSGSMSGLETDTIGGFNSMLKKQRTLPGKALVSTLLFNTDFDVIHDRVPIEQVRPLTSQDYVPGGCTALLDAVGGAISHIRNIHRYARPEDVPGRTLFIITTDGYENASRRYSADDVRYMIRKEKERYGWEFLFLGANIDAVETAGRMGITPEYAADYHADMEGTGLNFEVLSETIASVRRGSRVGKSWKSRIDRDYQERGR